MTTRDKAISLDILSVRDEADGWAKKLDSLSFEAEGEGALAHAALYRAAHEALVKAIAELERAGDLMNPDVTEVEDFNPTEEYA